MSEESQLVRIAVYNADMELLGYKADSCWTLHPSRFKPHPLDRGELPSHVLSNYLVILNKRQEFAETFNRIGGKILEGRKELATAEKTSRLFVIAQDEDSGKELKRYELVRKENDDYVRAN